MTLPNDMNQEAVRILGRPLNKFEIREAENIIATARAAGITDSELVHALKTEFQYRAGEDWLTSELFNRKARKHAGLTGSSESRIRREIDVMVKAGRAKGWSDVEIVRSIEKAAQQEMDWWKPMIGALKDELITGSTLDPSGVAPQVQTDGSIFYPGKSIGIDWDEVARNASTGQQFFDREKWEPRLDLPSMGYASEGSITSDDAMSKYLQGCSQENRVRLLDSMMKANDTRAQVIVTLEDGVKWCLRGDLSHANRDFLRIMRWLAAPLVLQKQDSTHFHDMLEALRKGDRFYRFGSEKPAGETFDGDGLDRSTPLFHIEHNWANLFSKSSETNGIVRLPFPSMAFEMNISGMRVCTAAYQYGETNIGISVLIEFKPRMWMGIGVWECKEGGPWVQAGKLSDVPWTSTLGEVIGSQIRATCIMLEAEVAETEVVRAPHKLNKARERRGEPPLVDYHVVKLAKRYRAAPREDEGTGEKRRSPRLHFRRGHWVHFTSHKTWRKWCLAGDVSLGWIDKYYEL